MLTLLAKQWRCENSFLVRHNVVPPQYTYLLQFFIKTNMQVCERIGFPVMIKASQGGGGKGIRKVESIDDVASAFRQVISSYHLPSTIACEFVVF